jgi:anti-sigma B factor antagonist
MDEVTDRPRTRLDVGASDDPGAPALLLRFAGDLDLPGATDVAGDVERLLQVPAQQVLLDLAEVGFCDSSGLALLIRLANHFGQVRTRAASEAVRRVMEVLGLAGRFGLDGA